VCNADAITIISNKAVIDPTNCNQCWKCLDACPYDAIY
jgi:Fe-S-cluster-containing hydrogenase component 2